MKTKLKYIFFSYQLLCIPNNLSNDKMPQIVSESNCHQKEQWLIIFIHGIIGIQPHLNLPNLAKFFRDKIGQSVYERTVELIRCDDFFYQHHPMQLPGLRKIDLSDKRPGSCATAYALLYEEIYKCYKPNTINYYYTFGWSGLLSSRMREYEAEILYRQLNQELEQFKKQNIHPKICLITYSHGGNIALKLVQVIAKDIHADKRKLVIDKLVLIGLPVLYETDFLINSSLFKKIYHVYSYGDRVQPLDCFSLGCLSSNRKFKSRPGFTVPEKLVQVELRVRKPRSDFECKIQQNNKSYINNRKQQRTYNPGHTELWSFGWSHHGYRIKSPLYPLPAATILPYLIHMIDSCHQKDTKLCIEIHPMLELMKWTNQETHQQYYYRFLSNNQFNHLKNIAFAYAPNDFSKKLHDKKIAEYKCQARLEWLNRRNIKRFGGIRVTQLPKS